MDTFNPLLPTNMISDADIEENEERQYQYDTESNNHRKMSQEEVKEANVSQTVGRFIKKRERERNNTILVFEIDSTKDFATQYKEVTLRSLLTEILLEVDMPHTDGKTLDTQTPPRKKSQSSQDITGSTALNHQIQEQQGFLISSTGGDLHRGSGTAIPISGGGMSRSGSHNVLSSMAYPTAPSSSSGSSSSSSHIGGSGRGGNITAISHLGPKPVATHGDVAMTYAVLGLRMRDLRRLDFTINPNEELTVQVRRNVVLFTVDPFRAIITTTKLRIIVPPGADTELTILEQYMREWLDEKKDATGSSTLPTSTSGSDFTPSSSSFIQWKPRDPYHRSSSSSTAAFGQNFSNIMSNFSYHHVQQQLAQRQTGPITTITTAKAVGGGSKTTTTPSPPHSSVVDYGSIDTTGTDAIIHSTASLVDSSTDDSAVAAMQLSLERVSRHWGDEKVTEMTSFVSSTSHSQQQQPRHQQPQYEQEQEQQQQPYRHHQHPLHQHSSSSSSGSSSFYQTFEIHAYESLLSTVKDMLTDQQEALNKKVENVLSFIRTGALVTPKVQERMNYLKDQIARLESKLKHYRVSLEQVIEDDETMALMNLTSLRQNQKLYSYPLQPALLLQHEEIEEALEVYLADFSAFESKLEFLKGQMTNAESQASLRLDIVRNRTLSATNILSLVTINVSFAAYITGAFGMNLDNVETIQPVPGVFAFILIFTIALMIVGSFSIYTLFLHWGIIQREDKALEAKYLN